jgi:hypothetical protein
LPGLGAVVDRRLRKSLKRIDCNGVKSFLALSPVLASLP